MAKQKSQFPRTHFLVAKNEPVIVILRRNPSKKILIIKWNSANYRMKLGSVFYGRIYPFKCDISFDGKWMVYLAMGSKGNTWNGVCLPPFLKTYAEGENHGTWGGGGLWLSRKDLYLDSWKIQRGDKEIFRINGEISTDISESSLGLLGLRMKRDGWKIEINSNQKEKSMSSSKGKKETPMLYEVWKKRPTGKHPELIMKYNAWNEEASFLFELENYSNFLDDVDWAGWDCLGQLVFIKYGILYKYDLKDLKKGKASYSKDLDRIDKLQKEEKK